MKQRINIISTGVGEPVTLIHGWGMNAAIFEPILPLLARHFEVIRVDLPGHGRSDSAKQLDFDQQVEWLADLVPDSTLLGWSMGGLFAIRLASKYPQKFKNLVLVSSNPCFVQKTNWQCAVEREIFDEFALSLIDDWQATIKRFIGLQLHGISNARELIRQVSGLLVKGGRPEIDALSMGLDLLLKHDARAELAGIAQPVLTILGARDKLVPKCLADQIPLINPQIRVECLAQSAHAPFISHAESVVNLLREFIKSPSSR
jgi:pimeloyl-[acyl-carrier protein] methyl ester esterase